MRRHATFQLDTYCSRGQHREALRADLNKASSIVALSVALFLGGLSASSAATVTKSWSSGLFPVSVDASSVLLGPVTFLSSDFPVGDQIQDVTVGITWLKGGSCPGPSSGLPYHTETGFEIQGPNGAVSLVLPGTYQSQLLRPQVTTVFNDGASAFPGPGAPMSGTFRPITGSLQSSSAGQSPSGSWRLLATDTVGADPLCVYGYTVTLDTGTSCVDSDGDRLLGLRLRWPGLRR